MSRLLGRQLPLEHLHGHALPLEVAGDLEATHLFAIQDRQTRSGVGVLTQDTQTRSGVGV
jgi:hypothetical protein